MRRTSLPSLLVLSLACAPPAAAQTPWVTVAPGGGGFSVEMPTTPSIDKNKTVAVSGGRVRVTSTGCTTSDGVYIAYKIELPVTIAQGAKAVDSLLDSQRDFFAQEWNGKVTGEKKVRSDGTLGRDFTIRGRPLEGAGVLTIRIREYLSGKAVYAVAVVSLPDRDLPADAGRFLGSLAIGEGKEKVAGAVEPEPTGRDLPGWGTAIDPDKDCEFRPTPRALAIKVPAALHDLHPDSGKLNAPRVMRAVRGDFAVTVKVAGDFRPDAKSTAPKNVAYNGAGILVWQNSDNFIRLERGAMLRGGKVGTIVAFEEREGGYRGAVHNEVFPGGDCYLRVERKGSRIAGAISSDGSRWKTLKPIDTVWPADLKAGLFAINTNSNPFNVSFQDFAFTGRGAGGR